MPSTRNLILSALGLTLAAVSGVSALEEDGRDLSDLGLDIDLSKESRIFTTTSGFSLSNATFDPLSLLAALLIGLLFYLTVGQSFLGGSNSGGSYSYAHNAHAQSSFYARSDKKIYEQDLANQMQQLAIAFKKYEVDELDCHLYVACESSQEHKHEENGVLAKQVHDVMSRIKKHGKENVNRKDKYVGDLLDAFVYGQDSHGKGNPDPCVKLRSKCYEATKKPEYK